MSPCGFASGLARAWRFHFRLPSCAPVLAGTATVGQREDDPLQAEHGAGMAAALHTPHSECISACSQEKRYMEMPRDWEEKINREMVNVGTLRRYFSWLIQM